jgi:hypothetical protein
MALCASQAVAVAGPGGAVMMMPPWGSMPTQPPPQPQATTQVRAAHGPVATIVPTAPEVTDRPWVLGAQAQGVSVSVEGDVAVLANEHLSATITAGRLTSLRLKAPGGRRLEGRDRRSRYRMLMTADSAESLRR